MHGISSLSLLARCYCTNCPRIFSCTMAEWETSQLSRSSSDTESQEERDVHTPRTPIQNVNLSYSSTSSNASPVETPKTKEINRLREENRRLKEQLQQALSLQPDRHSEHDDDDVQDADGRYKDWSQLGTFQKRKLVCDIETKLKLLADKKDTGIVNIAASIISRFATIFCSFFLFLVFLFSETLCHRHTWPRQRVVHDIAEQIENGSLMEEMKHVSELVASWILVRGKGGGFGRRIYRGLAKVFKLHRLGNFPSFEQIRSLWKNEMLTPINACTEGTSQVL